MNRASKILAFKAALALAAASALSLPSQASAQWNDGDRIVTVGIGAQVTPQYPGADTYGIYPWPNFGLRRAGEPVPFEAADDSFGFGLINQSGFSFGPALQIQGRRKDEDVGAPIGNVPTTIEIGAFAQAFLGSSFRLRAEARRGIGGHDGWNGDIGADAIIPLGRSRMSIGPRVRLADERYMDAYFGVDSAQAARTGLPAFDAGGGVHSVGATAGLDLQLSDTWGVYSYARYDRLVGDAADSPIVRTYGSRNQYSAGLGLTYSFRIGG